MAAILSAEEGKQLQRYDFRCPERVGSKLMVRLRSSLEVQTQVLGEQFSKRLKSDSDVKLRGAIEAPSERIFETPFDTVFALLPLVPSGQVFCRFDVSLAQMLVDRLLGGTGVPRTVERGPTRIEVDLLQLVAGSVQASLMRGEDPADSEATPEPQFVAARNRGDYPIAWGISSDFELAVAENTGVFQLFMTYADLSRVTGLEIAPTPRSEARPGEEQRFTTEHLAEMKLALRALMPAAPVPIREIAKLEVGDVLQLERSVSDEVEIHINDRVAFLGHPGVVRDSVGIQISKAL